MGSVIGTNYKARNKSPESLAISRETNYITFLLVGPYWLPSSVEPIG